MKTPKAPAGLREAGKRFWKITHAELELEENHVLQRLIMLCKTLDELAEDEEVVKREGRFIKDRFGQVKEHPASRAVRENKTLFCRIVRELGLDLNVGPETRIPGRY